MELMGIYRTRQLTNQDPERGDGGNRSRSVPISLPSSTYTGCVV